MSLLSEYFSFLYFPGVENSKFVCGAAEKVLYNEIKSLNKKNVIAVVDPPRAGLRKKPFFLVPLSVRTIFCKQLVR